jgi:hypothetical protein
MYLNRLAIYTVILIMIICNSLNIIVICYMYMNVALYGSCMGLNSPAEPINKQTFETKIMAECINSMRSRLIHKGQSTVAFQPVAKAHVVFRNSRGKVVLLLL